MRLSMLLPVIVLACTVAILLPSAPVAAQSQATLTIDHVDVSGFPNVSLGTTVVGPDGKPKLGLGNGSFEVHQSGIPVGGLSVDGRASGAVALVIAVDVSRSIRGDFDSAKRAAIALVDAVRGSDRVGLVSFGDVTRPVMDLAGDKDAVKQAIENLQLGTNTAFYDGLSTAVTTAAASSLPGRVVVVFSDGEEYGRISQAGPRDIRNQVQSGGVQIYTVSVGNGTPTSLFTEIAALTQGRHSESLDGGTVDQLSAHIDETLRQRYVLRFQHNEALAGDPPLAVRVKFGGQTADATATSCRDTSQPIVWFPELLGGSNVKGTSVLEPAILCPPGPVVRVDYLLDGDKVHTASTAPFIYRLVADKLERGEHELGVEVSFADGTRVGREASFRASGNAFNPAYLLLFIGLAAVVVVFFLALLARRRAGARLPTGGPTAPPSWGTPGLIWPRPQPGGTALDARSSAGGHVGRLLVVGGPTEGQTYELGVEPVVIGRAPQCDILLSGSSVSREHARLWWEGNGYRIRDLGSTNSTKVNGRRITETSLASGDRVEIPPYVLELTVEQAAIS